MLKVNELHFDYKDRQILKQIQFDLHPGEVLSILGPNGVGKTTLLRCINTILSPKRGTIMIQGESVMDMSRIEIARKMGYVAQHSEASRLTAFDAILLGRKPHIGWNTGPEDMEIVNRVIEDMGLKDLSMRFIDQMSGGELQQISLARALVQEPSILLLDEPTSNLDLKNQISILKTVRKVAENKGMSAIMTMHDINLALRFSDRYALIKDGGIYAYGGPEVLTPDNIEHVYDVPVIVETIKGYKMVVPLSDPLT